MAHSIVSRSLLVLPLLGACGSVDGETPDASPPPIDSPDAAVTSVRVSPGGDDAADGLTAPVRTIKRALGIAAANPAIGKLALAGGRYTAGSGETFPYTIATNLTIAGPAGGGAILEGTGSGPALMMAMGKLADIELEKFSVAVTATGITELAGVRIRDTGTALRGEAGSMVTASQLDITGAAGMCQTGIELTGDARLAATALTGRGLGKVVDAKGSSHASLAMMNIAGDAACAASAMFEISTTGLFSVTDSVVDGGRHGMHFAGAATPTTAMLTNTVIRNLTGNLADAITGNTVTMTMVGGELANNGRAGLEVSGGRWTLTNVTLRQNPVMAIYLQGGGPGAPAVLKMRGCSIVNNGTGIYLFDNAQADLGVDGDPGNNTFTGNASPGLSVSGFSGGRQIDAVGNTWRPGVQGADAQGKYATAATIAGPLDVSGPQNFAINAGWSLRR